MTRISHEGQPAHVPLRPMILLSVGLWATVYLYFTARSFFLVDDVVPGALARLVNCTTAVFMSGGLYFILRALRPRSFSAVFALALASSLLLAFVYAVFSALVYKAIAPAPAVSDPSFFREVLERSQASPWVFLAWCFGYLALEYGGRLKANELRLMELQALAADAQNRMLRYQIQPHFLFNTLTAISTLILRNENARAERMVMQLSKFLRHSLEASPEAQVSLREEIEAQEQYLAIEQERFGDRLRFEKTLDADLARTPVPSLILQPLVENSVKHAVAPTDRPVTIAITARREDGHTIIEVRDDGDGEKCRDEVGLGLGLENVRRRLAVIYGPEARFQHGPGAGGGYASTLTLPREAA